MASLDNITVIVEVIGIDHQEFPHPQPATSWRTAKHVEAKDDAKLIVGIDMGENVVDLGDRKIWIDGNVADKSARPVPAAGLQGQPQIHLIDGSRPGQVRRVEIWTKVGDEV